MKHLKFWHVLLFIYLLSTTVSYSIISSWYQTGNRWAGRKPGSIDVFLTFTPVVNTLSAVIATIYWLDMKYDWNTQPFYNAIFRVPSPKKQ